MGTQELKHKIQNYINRGDDDFLQMVYNFIQSTQSEKDLFAGTIQDMQERAEKSIESVENSKTRQLTHFKQDIESWKKSRNIS